ncbi:hypothetical protein HYPSUDRAFT_59829 [Hypholoma sublateritium FD-334 SS-4]|uniref:Uncharacterized protein n=1 Tax=Hypholoma sublateritium (strain FD-334 SS-4) TaxID=945553 RepID=A0A0D2KGB9_HYPSF|nr:hypothetical protein HYPSUDRAFT_59829 [Hypholoma sublateritium FD-334 SS-4]
MTLNQRPSVESISLLISITLRMSCTTHISNTGHSCMSITNLQKSYGPVSQPSQEIKAGLEIEENSCHLDLGPIDLLDGDPQALQQESDEFFGKSPLSSVSSILSSSLSPSPPSRSLSPDSAEYERALDEFYGMSPLSSLPSSSAPSPSPPSRPLSPDSAERERILDELRAMSPLSSLPSSSASSPPHPSTSLPSIPTYVEPNYEGNEGKSNSKNRRNKKKSHSNRARKRQEKAANQGQNTPSVSHPNAVKYVAAAPTTHTTYRTSDIPSASTGFIALPDRGSAKCNKLRYLLRRQKFKRIRWNGW